MSQGGKHGAEDAKNVTEEDASVDKKWWSQLFVASSWLPMAVHYSVEGGIGLNLGIVGLLGVMAGAETFRAQWEATKDIV